MKLQGKVAIVTGAASGMGRAIAVLFAKEGASVVVSDINLDGAKQTVATIEADGGTAVAVAANVAAESDIKQLVAETVSAYGTVDILINNAGIMDKMAAVGDVTNELWDLILAVNTTSVMYAMREVIPIFLEKQAGIIVNVASLGGLRGSIAGAAYTASKHAVVGLTKNTGYQYAKRGIRCNAIAPGAVKTNIASTMTDINHTGAAICQSGIGLSPRMGEPEEIATVALFLSCDDSAFVNGEIITVDGGWAAY